VSDLFKFTLADGRVFTLRLYPDEAGRYWWTLWDEYEEHAFEHPHCPKRADWHDHAIGVAESRTASAFGSYVARCEPVRALLEAP
jgi:hypothetical protein